jgi:ribosomal protein S18 acetylase RimI-like enzyme
LAGYGRAWARRSADFDGVLFVHPAHDGSGIGDCLLSLMEDRARPEGSHAAGGQSATLAVPAASVNASKLELLCRRGYGRVRIFFRMAIDLAGGFARARWPEPFEVHSVRRGDDDAGLHATLQDAFAEHYRFMPEPLDEWTGRFLAHEHFAPDLSFSVHHHGEAVGAVTNYLMPDVGWVGMLGVRRPWRGRGIAKALLLHSFDAFRRAGQDNVALGVDSENADGATRLYERAGMRVDQRHELFEKLVAPARG